MTRRVPWGLLAVLFVVVPLVEIYLIVQTGQLIGVGPTIAILVADSVLGAVLLKREGSAAWRALLDALASHRMPARELADGALVLVGGTLLLTPGFFTDVLGFLCILPFTRPLGRRALTSFIKRKFLGPAATTGFSSGFTSDPTGDSTGPRKQRRPGPDDVVQGEVVD